MTTSRFISELSREVMASVYNFHVHNVDPYRYPPPTGLGRRCIELALEGLHRAANCVNLIRVTPAAHHVIALRWDEMLARAEGLAELHELLADDASREIMIKVLAYRVLGSRRVKLPLNTPKFWDSIRYVETRLRTLERTVPIDTLTGHLNEYDLRDLGYPIRMNAYPSNIISAFILQQYRFDRNGVTIEAVADDRVIDGGACWGDTALYFAHRVGSAGKVVCFEASPKNAVMLEENLRMNCGLAGRVRILQEALWSRSGEMLVFDELGPGSRAGDDIKAGVSVRTRAVDTLVEEGILDRVDFIKLDVEGAELATLQGCLRGTIERFKPRLAVTLYHKLDDFIEIPRYLAGLNLGYRFYLEHFAIHHEETVLFAVAS